MQHKLTTKVVASINFPAEYDIELLTWIFFPTATTRNVVSKKIIKDSIDNSGIIVISRSE
jgi:hypothetical protein